MTEEKTSTSKVKKSLGSYKFRVEGYSALSTRVGESIESPEFSLCGHEWQLRIFPGGSLESHRGYVSFYLASKSTKMARASYKLIILNQVAGGIDETFTSSGVRTFEPKGVQVDGWGRDKFISSSFLVDVANGLFVDDTVVFKVEITLIGELENVNTLSDDSLMISRPTLEFHMNELLTSQTLCDVCLHIGEVRLYAHKCILAARSAVFRAMFMSSMSESLSGVVNMDDVDPVVMAEVLHFIYTDSFSNQNALESITEDLYLIASRYEILGLLSKCEDSFIQKISLENVLNILILGDIHGSRRMKEKCFHFIAFNYGNIIQSKSFLELTGDLKIEVQNTINAAIRRSGGCRGSIESEKKFGSSCVMM